jgi:hypothetical protein
MKKIGLALTIALLLALGATQSRASTGSGVLVGGGKTKPGVLVGGGKTTTPLQPCNDSESCNDGVSADDSDLISYIYELLADLFDGN